MRWPPRPQRKVSLLSTLARPEKPETVEPLLLWPPQNLSGQAVIPNIAFTPDGKDLAWLTINTTSEKVKGEFLALRSTRRLSAGTANRCRAITLTGRSPTSGSRVRMRDFAFSPDGKFLATGTGPRLIRWDVPPPGRSVDIARRTRLEDDAECLACSPDSKHVVVGCKSRMLAGCIRSTGTASWPCSISRKRATPRSLAFIDDRHVVSGDSVVR